MFSSYYSLIFRIILSFVDFLEVSSSVIIFFYFFPLFLRDLAQLLVFVALQFINFLTLHEFIICILTRSWGSFAQHWCRFMDPFLSFLLFSPFSSSFIFYFFFFSFFLLLSFLFFVTNH